MGDNFTLFSSGGGSGAGAADYLKDAFEDISIPASNNTGYSSTVSSNPLNANFANDDAPKYGAKTLWIKDLVLISDRSLWVNGKPTYRIVFNESFPGVNGYVYGNIRLRNYNSGISVDVRNIDDGLGLGGVIRRVQWILNPTAQTTGTADLVTDGADTGVDATFGSYSGTNTGINSFYCVNHESSNETKNIHDLRIQANEQFTLNVAGVVVYFENATTDIDCFPGSTYVNKDKKTTNSVSSLAIPAISGRLGGKISVTKTSANTYLANSLETPSIETIAVGSSGTNTVNVTTGQGSSYPIGTAVVSIASGSSYYIGAVTNVSTDTLTLGPTIGFGLSGPLYKAWRSGPTLAIGASLYTLAASFDPGIANVPCDSLGFGDSLTGNFYYTDPLKRYKAFGQFINNTSIDGTPGINFATLGFLQIDGNFAAAEIEYAGTTGAILHATFTVNGLLGYGVNEGFSGVLKRTVFSDSGPGWNSFRLSSGASFLNMAISKVNLYQLGRAAGMSFGLLSEFAVQQNEVPRIATNQVSTLGLARRVYSDEMYLTGLWGRTLSPSSAGGVGYQGASTNAQIILGYYGKDYSIVGNAFGSSVTVTLDGSNSGATFGVLNTVATEGFHTLQLNVRSVTAVIDAIDFTRTKQGMASLQNYVAIEGTDTTPATFFQSDTPRNPKSGDIWVQKPFTYAGGLPSVWIYLFSEWNRISILGTSDDPNLAIFVRTHGSSDSTAANATQTVEHFNFSSWSNGVDDTGGVRVNMNSGGSTQYNNFHHVIDGTNAAGTIGLFMRKYNKISWSADNTKTNSRAEFGSYPFAGLLWAGKGFNGAAKAETEKWNGSSWAAGPTLGTTSYVNGCFSVNSLINFMSGVGTTAHDTINSAAAAATATASPISGQTAASANSSGLAGVVIQENSTNSYVWNGVSWGAAIAVQYTVDAAGECAGACGFNPVNNLTVVNGGATGGGAAQNVTNTFNGLTWATSAPSKTLRSRTCGSIL